MRIPSISPRVCRKIERLIEATLVLVAIAATISVFCWKSRYPTGSPSKEGKGDIWFEGITYWQDYGPIIRYWDISPHPGKVVKASVRYGDVRKDLKLFATAKRNKTEQIYYYMAPRELRQAKQFTVTFVTDHGDRFEQTYYSD